MALHTNAFSPTECYLCIKCLFGGNSSHTPSSWCVQFYMIQGRYMDVYWSVTQLCVSYQDGKFLFKTELKHYWRNYFLADESTLFMWVVDRKHMLAQAVMMASCQRPVTGENVFHRFDSNTREDVSLIEWMWNSKWMDNKQYVLCRDDSVVKILNTQMLWYRLIVNTSHIYVTREAAVSVRNAAILRQFCNIYQHIFLLCSQTLHPCPLLLTYIYIWLDIRWNHVHISTEAVKRCHDGK